jgi:hypothetical protein
VLKLNPAGAAGEIAYDAEATELVMTYPVIAIPTVAVSLVGAIVKSGADGKPKVVFGLDGVDQSDVPIPFVALTLKMYAVSEVKSVTTKGDAPSWHDEQDD